MNLEFNKSLKSSTNCNDIVNKNKFYTLLILLNLCKYLYSITIGSILFYT